MPLHSSKNRITIQLNYRIHMHQLIIIIVKLGSIKSCLLPSDLIVCHLPQDKLTNRNMPG